MKGNILRDWLNRRKITSTVIDDFGVYWGHHDVLGECIVIPVWDINSKLSFNKYRRSPLIESGPKYLYDKGGKVSLYGVHKIKDENKILITEGEMDALVAWSAHIPAVSSTGGAMSFEQEWKHFFDNKEVILCFDNDEAGGAGMAKVLEIIPHAQILFLPDRPGVKDISDYVAGGGDLNILMQTAIRMATIEAILDNRAERISLWQSTWFHDAYIKNHTKPEYISKSNPSKVTERVARSKEYPIDQLIEFKLGKAHCIWHSEKTGSMHYFKDSNKVYCFGCGKGGDVIDVYRQLNKCSFKEAVENLQ